MPVPEDIEMHSVEIESDAGTRIHGKVYECYACGHTDTMSGATLSRYKLPNTSPVIEIEMFPEDFTKLRQAMRDWSEP